MTVSSNSGNTELLTLLEKWKATKVTMDDACLVVYRKMAQTYELPAGQYNNPTEEEMARCDAAKKAFEEIDRQLKDLSSGSS